MMQGKKTGQVVEVIDLEHEEVLYLEGRITNLEGRITNLLDQCMWWKKRLRSIKTDRNKFRKRVKVLKERLRGRVDKLNFIIKSESALKRELLDSLKKSRDRVRELETERDELRDQVAKWTWPDHVALYAKLRKERDALCARVSTMEKERESYYKLEGARQRHCDALHDQIRELEKPRIR